MDEQPVDLSATFLAEGGRILLLDPHLCVLDKPADWLAHPTHRERRAVSTVASLLARTTRVHPVNRLDRGTTGLLIVALDPYSHHALSEQSQAGLSTREYIGLVHGRPESLEGRIDAPIGVDPDNVVRRTVLADGKPAVTAYAVESSSTLQTPYGPAVVSHVRFRLETGRTHQIRVHCRFAGFPLIGDLLYGIRYGHQDDILAEPRGPIDARIARQALHAARIEFRHPVDGDLREFSSPLPKDMERVLEEAP
jgi:23S rRNA pseudouridine1911/1915/1917 synthase